jgi:hypothetical protein
MRTITTSSVDNIARKVVVKLVLANNNILHQITTKWFNIDAELRISSVGMMNMIVFDAN